VGDVDVEALGHEPAPHAVGERHVVLHHEHTHGPHCVDPEMRAG
jgi:hypothetical protein